MSIAKKILLLLVLSGAVVMGAIFAIQKLFIFPVFTDIENANARIAVNQIVEAIDADIEQLSSNTYDWGSWDDTYRFVEDRNPEYIESNLPIGTLQNNQTDWLYFLDTERTVVWGMELAVAEAEAAGTPVPAPAGNALLDRIRPLLATIDTTLTSDKQVVSGIVLLDRMPVIFAARSILDSSGQGPARGFVVQGRKLDTALIADLRKRLESEFNIDALPNGAPATTGKDVYAIRDLDGDLLEISRLYTSNGVAVMQVRTTFPREVTRNGLASIRYALMSILVVGVFSVVVIWVFLRVSVASPLEALASRMLEISETKDYSLRADMERTDEIGVLAGEFDAMLARVETSSAELTQANARIQQDNAALTDAQAKLLAANQELERLSVTDPLTGIGNRLRFETKLDEEWRALSRSGGWLSVIMVDVDHFKAFNDRYGHQAGDECLREVAEALDASLRRPKDLAARYGGEEFVLVLPGCDGNAADALAERVQTAIEALDIQHAKSAVADHVTVSMGIASVRPGAASTPEELMQRADAALYSAKDTGRNQFVRG